MTSLHQNGEKHNIKEEDSNEIGWGTQYVRGTSAEGSKGLAAKIARRLIA